MSVLGRELRRPLQTVHSHALQLSNEANGPVGSAVNKRQVDEMVVAGNQMDRVLLRMLHFGHALSDGLKLEEQKVPIKSLVVEALDRVANKAEQRGIALLSEIELESTIDIICDPFLVSQAIKSLVDNAVSFSRRGSQVIVRAQIGRGSDFCLSVEDSAPPLSKDILRQIFNTPEPSLGRDEPRIRGRDVGLSISRILAEAHQGTLGIHTASGEGNLAMLALPPSRIVLGIAQQNRNHIH